MNLERAFHDILRDTRRSAKLRRPWAERVGYYPELMKEALSFAGAPIFPIANNSTQYTGTVDMSKAGRVRFICGTGTVGGGGNVVFQLQQTNNSNGASNTNVAASNTGTGTAFTISASSQLAAIECRADQLTARYAQCSITVNTNQSTPFCLPETCEVRQHPQNTDDASVTGYNYA